MKRREKTHSRTRAPKSRGFTLTELAIVMLLSSVLMIGVFHIHATFQSSMARQSRITRLQQTMKVTRAMLERRLRAAGAGMSMNTYTVCNGEHQIGPFVLRNSNSLTGVDTTQGDQDTDPDWFEIMSADLSRNGRLVTQAEIMGSANKEVDTPLNFEVGDIVGFGNENGVCLAMITSVLASGHIQTAPAGTGQASLAGCYNDPLALMDCKANVLQMQPSDLMPAGSEIINFSTGTFALRIDDSVPTRPMLMMATGTLATDPTSYNWQPIAAHVEDMQIAVHLDTSVPSDELGDVWENSRDLTAAELDKVRAVRISLVFRTESQVPGWTGGQRPALEDRPAATTKDGYLRRVMRMVVKLRNMPNVFTPLGSP